MADVHDVKTRSYNMSRIRSRDTKPEKIVRSYLHKHGFRFRLHKRNLPGEPDIFLPKYHTVIFVNGCFWHGHNGCKYFRLPSSNKKFWKDKIRKNIDNDKIALRRLRLLNLSVNTVWECQLRKDKREKTLTELIRELNAKK